MAIDMFLRIDGIPGESTDDKHPDEIEVLAYSLGFSNSGSAAAGPAGGAGKPSAQALSLTIFNSRASLPLFTALCTGRFLREATLTLRKAGAAPHEFLTIRLEDVLVTSQSAGGSGGEDQLTENITLDYARIEFTYVGQRADGTSAEPQVAGFDFATNTPP